ncbi:MAG: S9 family peptidase [Planctomycetaceae bacterium]|nr:S9 family peptidase [Planctomycetaceae bacterium]
MFRSSAKSIVLWLSTSVALAAGPHGKTEPATTTSPMTPRVTQTDTYHGIEVPDPYRWLEDDVRTSPQVAEWVRQQNEHTFAFLEQIPERGHIQERLTQLWNFEKFGTPSKAGGRIFFEKNNGLQNQFVLYVQDSLEDEPRVLIDPNTWSDDGTVSLGGLSVSKDGRTVAYAVQEAGSDWAVWKFLKIDTGQVLEHELRWIKFNWPAWTADGEGVFYARFPEPEEGAAFQNLNLNQQVFYHRLGRPQSEDVLVFHRPDHPEWGYSCRVTEDGRYLVITVHVGTDDRYRVFVKDLHEPYGLPIAVIPTFDHEYSFISNDGPVLYFKTNRDAPRGRVIAMDLRQVDSSPRAEGEPPSLSPQREIIPEQPATMVDVSLVGNLFIVESLEDAQSKVTLYQPDGRFVRNVELPGIGSANGFNGRRTDTETFYSFSSFATPPSIFRYDLVTGESTLLRQAKVDFDPSAYTVEQVFYTSKDGTRVPMFLAYKKGLKRNGESPTLLYGYGGFNVSLTPAFSVSRLAWMEMGGLFAMPNLRGGGEYGEEWHNAGTRLQKQNVFDDFIAAAEWLIEHKYTTSPKLAIQGGSNGGLLVGACLTQRPELFGACLPAVGVMDMLRFNQFTAGRYWVDDYGSPDDPAEFKALLAYSPLHNIRSGVCYPPTLVTTADTDDRVVPGHSFKFAAALQQAQSCDNPILIRIETRAGHGAGKPTSKLIEELTDQWAFLVKVLGMTVE